MLRNDHQHNEAFALMRYRSDDSLESEVIWNSRDGVTPYVITLRSGKQATHTDWHRDEYAPNHVPGVGDRIFVDLTPEKATEYASANLLRFAASGMDMSNAPTPSELARDYLRPGAPDLIEVTAEWLAGRADA